MSILTFNGTWLMSGSSPATSSDCCCGDEEPDDPPTPCATAADCPTFGVGCEAVFPGAPESCCDGFCEPDACYPGAQITLSFTKKSGCFAPFLAHLADGDPFDVIISGGSLAGCGVTSAALSGAPCLTEWTLGENCVVSGLTFSDGGFPFCADCYQFVGWASCRTDCNGDCV